MKGGGFGVIGLLPLAFHDVASDRLGADKSGGADVVRTGPELIGSGLFCQRGEGLVTRFQDSYRRLRSGRYRPHAD